VAWLRIQLCSSHTHTHIQAGPRRILVGQAARAQGFFRSAYTRADCLRCQVSSVFVLKLSSFKAYFGVLISHRDSAIHHSSLLFQHFCEKGVCFEIIGHRVASGQSYIYIYIYIYIYTYLLYTGSAVAQRAFRIRGHSRISSRSARVPNTWS
jgi:hypothetical protein